MHTKIEFYDFKLSRQLLSLLWIAIGFALVYVAAYLFGVHLNHVFMLGLGMGATLSWFVWMAQEVVRDYRFIQWVDTLPMKTIVAYLLDPYVSPYSKGLLLLQLKRIARRDTCAA